MFSNLSFSLPSLIALSCVLLGLTGCNEPAPPLPNTLFIEVTGEDYQWHVRYPGRDGVPGNADDFTRRQDVVLAAGVPTKITLHSNDYLYGFELPDLDLTEIAVPDLTFSLEFTPVKAGTFRVRGHQMCNYTHTKLHGTLEVRSPKDFGRWLRKHST